LKTVKNIRLAELLYPDIKISVKDIIKTKWDNGGKSAFRFAPSPTGYLHIGQIGMVFADFMLAKSLNGKCYLRIEDTDQKREVTGAVQQIIETLKNFGIKFDNEDNIFIQSKRTEIYHAFAKDLVENGFAYPCFCSERDLCAMREDQERQKLSTGYYGKFAKCRNLTFEETEQRIKNGERWVLRANFHTDTDRIEWDDLIRGKMSLPAVQNDSVIVKSNGIPPYNLAACADDILMGITHIVRGEEWLTSTAEHIQLYKALGFFPPKYAHLPVICIMDGGSKRKLSKRKDREAIAQNFLNEGYPARALTEYLLTIYNTDYELWRIANPKADIFDFNFKFDTIGRNSMLFDRDKLDDISRNIIADMSCEEINGEVKKYFTTQADSLNLKGPIPFDKIFTVLAVDRGTERPRKDITKYSEILTVFDYLFKPVTMTPLLTQYVALIKGIENKDEWFMLVKSKSAEFGFKNVREFTQAVRLALTGREHSTDLYTISKILL
jgi:glutamyl-tRNA synthetase